MQHQYLDIKNSLSITSNLKEAITLLKYSYLELENYLNQKIQENPFLSLEEESDEPKSSESLEAENILEEGIFEVDFSDHNSTAIYDNLDEVNSSSENNSYENKSNFTDDIESYSISLKEYLLEQISIVFTDDKERLIATYLVDFIDDNGYLETNFQEIICADLKCTQDTLEKIVLKLQDFEPIGVFARSLAECLAIQLKHKNLYNEKYQELLLNLTLLSGERSEKLLKKLKISSDELLILIEQIKKLNPKPGSSFSNSSVVTLIPDVLMQLKNGNYTLELNLNYRNNVHLDKTYYQQIRQKIAKQESTNYAQEMYNNAKSVINALTHRDQNLYLVTSAIIDKQLQFFNHGINHFVPLSLSDIASKTGLSISTVSRIVANKYIATPIGTFKLKYFFSSSTKDELLSSRYVKNLIKRIIDNEKEILSDEKIMLKLKSLNIDLSRRAVTKYRESMRILSSTKRKKISWIKP
jgi:RNA polymerase sigma-54 factor